MKNHLLLFTALFFCIGYSQQTNLSPNLLTFPVSPEAGRLGTFGDIPINLFYGRLEKNIELFNGKVGDFNLPIQLSYNYAGNRLEETPSIIGLGWQLNLGGVVTREVRGLPDEHPRGYDNTSIKEIVNNYINNNTILDLYAKKIANGFYDSEADKYNLSVNGIHFSFKIGVDGNPAFLSKHDNRLKIIRNLANSQIIEAFVLTDDSANQYFFEQKEINEPYLGYSSFFDEVFPFYTSSWQLSKIKINNGQEIIFNYDDDDFISYNFYANVEIRNRLPHVPDVYNLGCTSDIIKRKILKSINTPNFNINFSYIKQNNHEVYNSMSISDVNNTIVDSYVFSYLGKRNLLENITKNSHFFYGFEYIDDNNLPDFTNSIYDYPNNVDEWGFANGANNLTPIFVNGTNYNANKKPNFYTTVSGALVKIKYPTMGITNIAYEQNVIGSTKNANNEPNVTIDLKFKSDFLPDAPTIQEKVFTKTFNHDVAATLSHYIENKNYISLSIKKISNEPAEGLIFKDSYDNSQMTYYTLAPHARSFTGVDVPLIHTFLNEMATEDNDCESFNNCSINQNSQGKFLIPRGTYEFKFRTEVNRTKNVKAEVILSFYDSVAAEFMSNETTVEVGGIRVRQTTDYPLNSDPITKYYEYTNADGQASGFPFNEKNLFSYLLTKETCCADYTAASGLYQFKLPEVNNLLRATSRPYNLSMQNSSPIGYLAVKEYVLRNENIVPKRFLCENCGGNFGSNWDNTSLYSYNGTYGTKKIIYPQGYKMTNFYSPKLKNSEYPFTPMGTDLSIGIEESKLIYSNNDLNTNNKKLFEESNLCIDTDNTNYEPILITNNPNYPKSLKVAYKVERIDNSQITFPFTINDFFYFKIYKEFDLQRFIYSKKTTEYINNQPVEKNIDIEYDSRFKQKKITTTFDSNNIFTNELFYPYDFTDPISQNMVSKNFISPVVKIINKKNGESTDSYYYEFSGVSMSDNLFKPMSFSKSKGNNPLERRNIYGYDDNGNLNYFGIVSTDNPTPRLRIIDSNTMVIWGYNKTQIVAKIENSTSVNIQSNLISDIETASSATGSEASLMTALNALRNDPALANAMITTYTHKPLIGVSTITDPKGLTTYYDYDDQNRLQYIKDKDLNILQKYCYNFKGQVIDCAAIDEITYKSLLKSGAYIKNDCPSGGTGSSIVYTVPAGTYTSVISQSDADAKAQNDLSLNGQTYSNQNGTCIITYYNELNSQTYIKNDCPAGAVGSSVTYTIAAGTYSSTVSQADANNRAQIMNNRFGQIHANANGTCRFSNTAKSGVFTKNNCSTGSGSTVTFTVAAGSYTSIVSQADADAQAQNAVMANGQSYANTNGVCGFYNIATSQVYVKNNCGIGYIGSSVTYTVPAGVYFSTTSQKSANLLALSDVINNGQTYANTNGSCTVQISD